MRRPPWTVSGTAAIAPSRPEAAFGDGGVGNHIPANPVGRNGSHIW